MTTEPQSPPHLIVEVNDAALGRLGYLVVDRPVRGLTSGGVRFSPDVSPAELASLARTMTHKWAFLNVPMGGAKAGICADPAQLGCERAALMEAFGRALAPLVRQGVYAPGTDMGTDFEDLQAIMRGAGRPLVGQQIDAAVCTALTVFETIRQTAQFHGLALPGLRVGLEGFGKVGSLLAEMLAQAGARLAALSTLEGALADETGLDVPRLMSLKGQYGDRLVQHYPGARKLAREALFAEPVDVLVPGARPGVIHAGNADHLSARWIVPIANAPVTPEAEQRLHTRGLAVLPDFVANCGGVLGVDMLGSGFNIADVRGVVEGVFAAIVVQLLRRAQQAEAPVGQAARALAWQNHHAFDADTPGRSAPLLERLNAVLRREGGRGLWRRAAWRAHHRWPGRNRAVHRAAVERYAAITLGVTLTRLAAPAQSSSQGEPRTL